MVGPRLPGADAEPLYETRGRGGSSNTLVSPLELLLYAALGVLAAYWSTEPPRPASEDAVEAAKKKKKTKKKKTKKKATKKKVTRKRVAKKTARR